MKDRLFIHLQIRKYFVFLIFLLVVGTASSNPLTTDILSTPELIKVLQAGSNIIYMRHGPTDHSQKDKNRHSLDNCDEQRNLSNSGRELLTQIREKFSSLNIPIGNVSSSPYCRCKETAQLVFGKFKVEPDLQFSISKNKAESEHLGKLLYQMMMNAKVDNKNNIFVGHTSNLRDGLGVWPKPEGVMMIFKKSDDHQLIYRGMITPDMWLNL
jgi:phosphohistidine phosphatase SixA